MEKKMMSSNSVISNGSMEWSSAYSESQVVMDVAADHRRVMSEQGTLRWHKTEEKVKNFSKKVSSTFPDATAKDELIKQQSKFAEEAVSGWEKSEAEAAALRQHLEYTIHQKLAAEDRICHLDEALKECMQQLRLVREEQEEKIHDAVTKNTKLWERIYSELELKLADAEQRYLEKELENNDMSKRLHEQAKTISRLNEAHSKAETELKVLKSHMRSLEKENALLKHERSLPVRGQNGKNTKTANGHVKKTPKLEEERQSQKGVPRKTPGNGTFAKSKLESGGRCDKNQSDSRKVCSEDEFLAHRAGTTGNDETLNVGKDLDVLLERLGAMEDETRRLKELLARKDSELQTAVFMSSPTSANLSSVKEQLDSFPESNELSSTAQVCEDGKHKSGDLMASMLMMQSGKRNVLELTGTQYTPEPCRSSSENGENCKEELVHESGRAPIEQAQEEDINIPEAHFFWQQICSKLASAEEELSCVESQSAATKTCLQNILAELDMVIQVRDNEKIFNIDRLMKEIVRIDDGKLLQEKSSAPSSANEIRSNVCFHDFVSSAREMAGSIKKLVICISNHVPVNISIQDNMPSMVYQLVEKTDMLVSASNLLLTERMDTIKLFRILSFMLNDLWKEGCFRNDWSAQTTEQSICHGDGGESGCHTQDSSGLSGHKAGCNNKGSPSQEIVALQDELRKIHAEKAALEAHMKAEFERFSNMERDVEMLNVDKQELEEKLKFANTEIDHLQTKLQRIEQIESNLWAEFLSAKSSRQLVDEQLSGINVAGEETESQLKVIVVEWSRLQYRVTVLEREISDKREKNALLELKCKELLKQLHSNILLGGLCYRNNSTCTNCSAINMKEQQSIQEIVGECVPTRQIDYDHDDDNDSNYQNSRRHEETGTDLVLESRRQASAADILDQELASLSRSGRPLVEFFGERTPDHEHYIQALEELSSSSDEEIEPDKMDPIVYSPGDVGVPLSLNPSNGKQTKTLDTIGSKSMNRAVGEKHNRTISRLFFSRPKRFNSSLSSNTSSARFK